VAVTLRDVKDDDLSTFYDHQQDAGANHMAAFTASDPSDRTTFLGRWGRILGDPRTLKRTVVVDGEVAGHILCFRREGQSEVTYWLARDQWGQGVATEALATFVRDVATTRPLHARAAKDHAASRRVLEKVGFVVTGGARGFAHARGQEIDEVLLTLR
jgi:RimJ/RimL family protein N-acetyltransferase